MNIPSFLAHCAGATAVVLVATCTIPPATQANDFATGFMQGLNQGYTRRHGGYVPPPVPDRRENAARLNQRAQESMYFQQQGSQHFSRQRAQRAVPVAPGVPYVPVPAPQTCQNCTTLDW